MNQREMTRKIYRILASELMWNIKMKEDIRIYCAETGTDAEARRIEKAILDLSDRLLNKSKVLK